MSCDFEMGDSDRIIYNVTSDFNNLTALTSYGVVRPESVGGSLRDIISHWRYAAVQDKSWVLMQHSTNGWHWEVAYDDSNNSDYEQQATPAPAAGEWFIIIGRWAPNRIELDIKKLSDGTTGNSSSVISHTSISDASDTTDFVVGAQDDPASYFDGLIGTCAVWDADLSDAEVVALQNRVHPLRIRPANIKFIVDLWTPNYINDYGPGHYSGTYVGDNAVVVGDHPPVSPPFSFDVGLVGDVDLGLLLALEGYRFRNDDNDEVTATWRQNQDIVDSVAVDTNIRLRTLVDSTGDPAAQTYQLEYQRKTGGSWRKVGTALGE